jgi:hypothetical protein
MLSKCRLSENAGQQPGSQGQPPYRFGEQHASGRLFQFEVELCRQPQNGWIPSPGTIHTATPEQVPGSFGLAGLSPRYLSVRFWNMWAECSDASRLALAKREGDVDVRMDRYRLAVQPSGLILPLAHSVYRRLA